MATFTYRIKGKTNPGNIRIRVKQGDAFDFEISTGLKCKLNHWDKKAQRVRNIATATYKDSVNMNLRNLRVFVEEEYFNDIALGIDTTQKWLKEKVNIFFKRPNNKQITGKKEYYEMIENYWSDINDCCKSEVAIHSIDDVRTMKEKDYLATYFCAGTLKYFYIAFAGKDVFDFDAHIFNTEAHSFRRDSFDSELAKIRFGYEK